MNDSKLAVHKYLNVLVLYSVCTDIIGKQVLVVVITGCTSVYIVQLHCQYTLTIVIKLWIAGLV